MMYQEGLEPTQQMLNSKQKLLNNLQDYSNLCSEDLKLQLLDALNGNPNSAKLKLESALHQAIQPHDLIEIAKLFVFFSFPQQALDCAKKAINFPNLKNPTTIDHYYAIQEILTDFLEIPEFLNEQSAEFISSFELSLPQPYKIHQKISELPNHDHLNQMMKQRVLDAVFLESDKPQTFQHLENAFHIALVMDDQMNSEKLFDLAMAATQNFEEILSLVAKSAKYVKEKNYFNIFCKIENICQQIGNKTKPHQTQHPWLSEQQENEIHQKISLFSKDDNERIKIMTEKQKKLAYDSRIGFLTGRIGQNSYSARKTLRENENATLSFPFWYPQSDRKTNDEKLLKLDKILTKDVETRIPKDISLTTPEEKREAKLFSILFSLSQNSKAKPEKLQLLKFEIRRIILALQRDEKTHPPQKYSQTKYVPPLFMEDIESCVDPSALIAITMRLHNIYKETSEAKMILRNIIPLFFSLSKIYNFFSVAKVAAEIGYHELAWEAISKMKDSCTSASDLIDLLGVYDSLGAFDEFSALFDNFMKPSFLPSSADCARLVQFLVKSKFGKLDRNLENKAAQKCFDVAVGCLSDSCTSDRIINEFRSVRVSYSLVGNQIPANFVKKFWIERVLFLGRISIAKEFTYSEALSGALIMPWIHTYIPAKSKAPWFRELRKMPESSFQILLGISEIPAAADRGFRKINGEELLDTLFEWCATESWNPHSRYFYVEQTRFEHSKILSHFHSKHSIVSEKITTKNNMKTNSKFFTDLEIFCQK